ncbi:MAG: hypothetical protein WA981_09895, partial [Glaciecola sp.]
MHAKYLTQLIIIFICISMFSACSKPKTEQEVLDHAATLSSAEAEIYLKNYLSKSQRATSVRIKLAEMMVKQGDYENALAQYDKVQVDLSSVQIPFKVEALYMTSSFERVLRLLDKGPFNAQSISTVTLVYALLEKQINNDLQALISLSSTANARSDKSALSEVVIATADFASHMDQSKYVASLKSIVNNSAELQSNWFVINLLATTSFAVKEYDTSVFAFDLYTQMRPEYLKIQLLKATALVYARRFAEAKPILASMLQAAPEQALANQLYAYVAIQDLDYEQAKLNIEKAIQNGYANKKNYLFAVEVNYRLKNYEQTVAFIEKAFANSPITDKYYNILMYSKSVTGSIDQVIEDIESADVNQENNIETLGALASGLQDVGNNASLAQLFDKLTAGSALADTDSLELALIASSNNISSYAKLGLDASEKVLDSYFNDQIVIEPRLVNSAKSIVIANLISQQKYQETNQTLSDWQSRKADPFNILLMAEAYNVQGQYNNTIDLLAERISSFNNAAVYNALASAYFETNESSNAIATAEQGLQRFPFNLDLLRQYSDYFKHYSLEDTSFITGIFNDKQLESSIALAIFYGVNQQPSNALKALMLVPKEQQSNVLYLHTLAEVHINNNDNQSALDAISQVLRLQKLTVDEIKYVLSTLRSLNDVDLQIELLTKFSPTFPNNKDLKLLLSAAYLANNDTKAADRILETFELETEQYWALKAKTAVNLSKFNDADMFYSRAYARYPSDRTVVEYAQFLNLTGNQAKALNML